MAQKRAVKKQSMRRTIVYCSFENRFAMGGGLGQVSVLAPRALARSGENVIFVSPYHSAGGRGLEGMGK